MIAPFHSRPARRRSSLPLQMLIGLLLGLRVGMAWPSLGRHLQPIGAACIQAIQMIVSPLIFAAVKLGVYRMGENARQLGRVAVIAFVWFYLGSFFAILVALGVNGVFHPGVGANLVATGKEAKRAHQSSSARALPCHGARRRTIHGFAASTKGIRGCLPAPAMTQSARPQRRCSTYFASTP